MLNQNTKNDTFITNLSIVTSNGSLVKLNLADDEANEKRRALVQKRNYQLDHFQAAVFIYFCNVLAQKGFAAGAKEQKASVLAVAGVLSTSWVLFHTGRDHADFEYSTVEELMVFAEEKLTEAFSFGLNNSLRPSAQSLLYIFKDFDRISKVAPSI